MQNPKPPNILVADDHAMMRDGIVLMIQAAWPDSRCEIADDFQSVMAKIDASNDAERFNAIVLDLRMPGMRGADSVSQITQRAAGVPVIVCTALEDPSLVERLTSSGIYCAVNKTTGSAELLKHLRSALETFAQEQQAHDSDGSTESGVKPQKAHQASGSAKLTARQREILKMLHTGKPSKVIASQLGIGLGTIKSHLHTLYSVMEVNNRSEAIVKSQNWLL
ncbi:MAG: response regulator transcription factor [Polaromonas sp.]|jgi:DNA-binding NarL/FixJ family response regulator|nr:response regulator transcription factor [Polaromonas sp.]MBK7026530.1 response regulator transcription factor [Polaromonas sp.]MBL0252151.1 response regulator transcription factor [Polaromonas sp.]MBP6089321.1 response regulator transcription factor [Polaromonas sp.]MBP6142650.1 response regulator transcription factor [Polaromonas sp.]